MQDVFANDELRGEFFKFGEAGSAVQGTYVGKREGQDGFGNAQIIYTLKDTEGKLWSVGFKTYTKNVHDEMAKAKFGQIIGFRFDGKRPSKANPGKFFNAYSVRTLGEMDPQWLAEHPEAAATATTEAPTAVAPMSNGIPSAAAKSAIEPDSLSAIRTLAKTKGITGNDEEVDREVTSVTGMELTEANVPQIIVKLTAFSK